MMMRWLLLLLLRLLLGATAAAAVVLVCYFMLLLLLLLLLLPLPMMPCFNGTVDEVDTVCRCRLPYRLHCCGIPTALVLDLALVDVSSHHNNQIKFNQIRFMSRVPTVLVRALARLCRSACSCCFDVSSRPKKSNQIKPNPSV